MNKKGQIGIGTIILLFIGVAVIVGAFIPEIFNQQATMTTKQTVTDEVISIASIRNASGGITALNAVALNLARKPAIGDWQYAGGCPVESFVLKNGSKDIMALNTAYVVNANYYNVTFNQSSDATYGLVGEDNNTYVTYTNCQDGYIQNSGGRSIAGLIGLFAVLAFVVWFIWQSDVVNFIKD